MQYQTKRHHIFVCLFVEEVVAFCGVPEALLSDRGLNLLSHLVQDVCKSMIEYDFIPPAT